MVKLLLPLVPSLKPGEAAGSRGLTERWGGREWPRDKWGTEPEDTGSESGLCSSTCLVSLQGLGEIQNLFFLSPSTTEP